MGASRILSFLAGALVLVSTGCSDPRRIYSAGISAPEAQVLIERGPRRLSLGVVPAAGYVQVNNIRVQGDDKLLADEVVTVRLGETPFVELSTSTGCSGVLGGTPAGEVHFDSTYTRFFSGDLTLSCTDFVTQIQDLIGSGSAPMVQARRTPGPLPQDPEDPVFFAQRLTITDKNSSPDAARPIRLSTNADNLWTCSQMGAPLDCTLALMLLGQPFIVRYDVSDVSAGYSPEIIIFSLDDREVRSVTPSQGQLILTDGTVARFVDGTRIDGSMPNDTPGPNQLTSLQAVADAVAKGQVVRLKGSSVLQMSLPVSLVAIRVSMQIVPNATSTTGNQTLAFQASVLGVDPKLGTVTLPLQTDVQVTGDTVISGDYDTLSALAEAVGNGVVVRADVVGEIAQSEPRLVVNANTLRLSNRPVQ